MVRGLAIALLLAACGDSSTTVEYDCQAICQYPNGSVLGSSKPDYTEVGESEDDAVSKCEADAASDGDRCDAGGTVMRCSCDEIPQAD